MPLHVKTDCPQCFGIGWFYVYTPSGIEPETCCGKIGWARPHHIPVLIEHAGIVTWVDSGIYKDVLKLWKAGIPTWISCEGSYDYARMITLEEPNDIAVERARAMLDWPTLEIDRRSYYRDFVFLRPTSVVEAAWWGQRADYYPHRHPSSIHSSATGRTPVQKQV